MTSLEQLIRKAGRRRLGHNLLRCSGLGLVIGLGFGFLGLGIDRVFDLHVGLWMYLGLAGLGVFGGAAWAASRRVDQLGMVVDMDRALHLRDRLGSAYKVLMEPELQSGDTFAPLVIQEGDRLAERVDIRGVIPVRVTGIWGVVALLIAVLAGGYIWIPSWEPSDILESGQVAVVSPEVLREQAEIRAVLDEVRAELRGDNSGAGAEVELGQEDMDALDALAEQLTEQGNPGAGGLDREEVAARINEVADDLELDADRNLLATEELAQRFSGMAERELPLTAEEFEEALRRGEFGEAADLLDRMGEEGAQWSEDERVTAAERLRELGEQARESDGEEIHKTREELELALEEQGLEEEEIESILEEKGAEEAEQKLTEDGVNKEVARQLARDIEEYKEEKERQEQADREGEEIGKALEEVADELAAEPEAQPSGNEEDTKQEEEVSEETAEGEAGEGERVVREDEGGEESSQMVEEQGVKDDKSGEEGAQPDMEMLKRLMDKMDSETLKELAESVDPDMMKKMAEKMKGMEPEQLQELMKEIDPEKLKEMMEGMDQETMEKLKEMAEGMDSQPQESQGVTGGESESEGEDGLPSEVLRELDRRRGVGERKQEISKELRERARELLEGMSKEERERWAGAWDKTENLDDSEESGGGQDTTGDIPGEGAEVVDITGDMEGGEIVGRWLMDEDGLDGGALRGNHKASVSRRLKIEQVRKRAERAVEEQRVPKRYHGLIKRYFGRFGGERGGKVEEKREGK